MDRAQPGARGSTNRNIEFGETTSQYSDGWIVPSDDPTLSAQRYTSLDETAFNEFDAAYTTDSLTVTIDPGEAFVDGWLARDTSTDIDLEADTAGQTVVIGWDPDAIYDNQQHAVRDEADKIIVALEGGVVQSHPTVEIWTFDTDANGVTNAEDHRNIGPTLGADIVDDNALNLPSVVVKNPQRLPISALYDGESIEIAVRLSNSETIHIYRWGAFDVGSGSAPIGLSVELLDDNDNVQESATTANTQNVDGPIASHTNSSGSESVVKLRAKNDTGTTINDPGVGAHFSYVVV
jgi:hypothetical protein